MPGERDHPPTNPLTLLLWYTYTCTRDEMTTMMMAVLIAGHLKRTFQSQAGRQADRYPPSLNRYRRGTIPHFLCPYCGARQSFENAGANPTLCPMFARPSASASSSSVSARAIPGQLSQGGVCIIIMMATIWGRYEWRVHIHIILLYPPTRCGLSPGLVWEYRRLDGLVVGWGGAGRENKWVCCNVLGLMEHVLLWIIIRACLYPSGAKLCAGDSLRLPLLLLLLQTAGGWG